MYKAQRLTEIGDGIYCDLNPQDVSDSDGVREHYRDDAIRILDSDKAHYARLKAHIEHSPSATKYYHTVADIGGGHPKLAATCVNCSEIKVYDNFADDYKLTHDEFLKRYPFSGKVDYIKQNILADDFTPKADLAIFCHVLEHLTIEDGDALINRVDADSLLIYQPNIGAAQKESWFHYSPKDHITFHTLKAMVRRLERLGYPDGICFTFSDDYYILVNRRK